MPGRTPDFPSQPNGRPLKGRVTVVVSKNESVFLNPQEAAHDFLDQLTRAALWPAEMHEIALAITATRTLESTRSCAIFATGRTKRATEWARR